MQPDMDNLKEVNTGLIETASDPRQKNLQTEVTDIEDRSGKLGALLSDRVQELKASDEKWEKYYGDFSTLSDWLNDRQEALKRIQESQLPPDQQYDAAKVSVTMIFTMISNFICTCMSTMLFTMREFIPYSVPAPCQNILREEN